MKIIVALLLSGVSLMPASADFLGGTPIIRYSNGKTVVLIVPFLHSVSLSPRETSRLAERVESNIPLESKVYVEAKDVYLEYLDSSSKPKDLPRELVGVRVSDCYGGNSEKVARDFGGVSDGATLNSILAAPAFVSSVLARSALVPMPRPFDFELYSNLTRSGHELVELEPSTKVLEFESKVTRDDACGAVSYLLDLSKDREKLNNLKLVVDGIQRYWSSGDYQAACRYGENYLDSPIGYIEKSISAERELGMYKTIEPALRLPGTVAVLVGLIHACPGSQMLQSLSNNGFRMVE